MIPNDPVNTRKVSREDRLFHIGCSLSWGIPDHQRLYAARHTLTMIYHKEASASVHLPSARLTNSSYTVHASAELTAFLPILNPNPSNKLLTPSSLTICRLACTIFAYFPGINCNRVLTASKGLVMAVANPAASTPLTKLIGTEDLVFISPREEVAD